MAIKLNGATRLYYVVGDPIAQVKSPQGVTEWMQQQGFNGACIPAHVAPSDLEDFVKHVKTVQNIDGVIVTVPHKIAYKNWCDTVSEEAAFLGAVNTIRKTENGWHGDMFDGQGYVTAILKKGGELQDKNVLLAGAGGAGSAIAYSLLKAGVTKLAIHEQDVHRRDDLILRLQSLNLAEVVVGSEDPSGFDVVINATPTGIKAGDALPFQVDKLQSGMFAGDVITQPEVSPFIEAARAIGCNNMIGLDMFAEVRDLMVQFLLQQEEANI
ncbi:MULTISPECIES: shikimate dehydrogenase family protein [Vitreoscilla]|uniref:Shikimate dehydrogenase n=1 Tax=Vitreoscilla stercoraria TaxID=61 RepID=A0ABY4EDV3_VITST|nr:MULTISPECIES: hypothetical protein [Vitreoscilla]AUZ05078.2 putative shikimate dehydrogenase [Vitreoscilla sp. C1]UOO93617.1 shikimate dehydrogenase [Vitreoscilla stercoraria]